MSLFFPLWVRACLGHGCRELRSVLCDARPESWGASRASVWARFGTNSAKIMLTLGCFCMMLHNVSQRRRGVSSEWLPNKRSFIFCALNCKLSFKVSPCFFSQKLMCNVFTKCWFLNPGTVDSPTPEESPPSSLQRKIWLINQIQTFTLPPWCQDQDLHMGDRSVCFTVCRLTFQFAFPKQPFLFFCSPPLTQMRYFCSGLRSQKNIHLLFK